MNASKRRELFKDQLRGCNTIYAVTNGPKRNVCIARTDTDDAFVWSHYREAFDFWGGSVQKNNALRKNRYVLIHAFLGAQSDEYYIVPDKKFHSGDFYTPLQNKNGSEHWKLAVNGGGGRNGELLNEHYTALCEPFE